MDWAQLALQPLSSKNSFLPFPENCPRPKLVLTNMSGQQAAQLKATVEWCYKKDTNHSLWFLSFQLPSPAFLGLHLTQKSLFQVQIQQKDCEYKLTTVTSADT